jgi:hypothetical protein
MPTPNDFSNVQFGAQQQDYKTSSTDSEQRPGIYGQVDDSTLPTPQSGDYPRIFDSGAGEHYIPTPGNYPIDYTRVMIPGGAAPSEYGQAQGQTGGYYPGPDIVPDNVPSKQFSSGDNGDPRALAKASGASQSNFANLQEFLNNNLETMGCRVVNPQTKLYKPPHGAEGE